MEGLEQISFEIISTVGTARSCYIEAIYEAKKGMFDQAEALIKEGNTYFTQGHHVHTQLIQKEASGETIVMNVLLTHAQDQLMSAEGFKIIAVEMIDLYREIFKLKNK